MQRSFLGEALAQLELFGRRFGLLQDALTHPRAVANDDEADLPGETDVVDPPAERDLAADVLLQIADPRLALHG
jgi:hypothetical protein